MKQIPKLTLKIKHKNGQEKVLYPSPRKMRKMLNASLEKKLKSGAVATFRVTYGRAETAQGKKEIFYNEMTTDKLDDLRWGVSAFLDEFLYLPAEQKLSLCISI